VHQMFFVSFPLALQMGGFRAVKNLYGKPSYKEFSHIKILFFHQNFPHNFPSKRSGGRADDANWG